MARERTQPQPERVPPSKATAQPTTKPAKSTKRSRSKATHHDERGRDTRVQEGRAELFERADENQPYVRPTSLEAPPPLPGMRQRWIRVRSGNTDDEKNLNRKLREGWRARPANTVPKNFQVPTMKHGPFAGTVMVEGMLLCQIPVELAKKREKYFRDLTGARTRAVNESLMRVNEGAGGGFGPIKKGERSQVVREVRKPKDGEDEVDLS